MMNGWAKAKPLAALNSAESLMKNGASIELRPGELAANMPLYPT